MKLRLGSFQPPTRFYFLLFFFCVCVCARVFVHHMTTCHMSISITCPFLVPNDHHSHIQWNVRMLCGLEFQSVGLAELFTWLHHVAPKIDWLRCPMTSKLSLVFLSFIKRTLQLQPCNQSTTVINHLLFLQDSL